MKHLISTIVTHPCTLFRDGLQQMLSGTKFKTVHVAAEPDEETFRQFSANRECLWLMGLDKCDASSYGLVRKVATATPKVKSVVLAQSKDTGNVVPVLEAGASGFLLQDITCEKLIKSLELIALGETVVPSEFLWALCNRASTPVQANGNGSMSRHAHEIGNGAENFSANGHAGINAHANGHDSMTELHDADIVAQGLSRREVSILRLLMQGASNKVIALHLAITEATVKVHVKAILRKLRLHNRTQAAMWAFSHLPRGENGTDPALEMATYPDPRKNCN